MRLRKPRSPPDPPQGPAPEVQFVFSLPPAEAEEVDEEMESEGSEVPESRVGDFVAPSRKKVIKSPFMKRASLRSSETWSSVFAKAGKLSAQDLVRLSEQCSAVAKEREGGRPVEEAALPATEDDQKRRRHIF